MMRFRNKLKRFFLLLCGLFCASCSYTRIDRHADGTFRYVSTRDSALDSLRLMRDGEGAFELEINGASGQASSVIDAQASFLRALADAAFEAGLRSAREAMGPR